ncbi:undecaprenyl/decaprenyl-phosphate alpha-N-acetylglucosaminyl 1-phosphate transferase [Streptomyces sp. NPDC017890]|uniref:undecaprenyl/decaprenyl-phosphate alpha-N-acetylglucosaminyl 1-phosphate transferase n=1 Tax=Streptomyces sp. NPDC017890 TaxID=3365015 RepID=UPI0037A56E82
MLYGIAAAIASFLLAALLTALLRGPALRLSLVDRRRQRPVPLLGGVAVVLVAGLVAWAGDQAGVVPLGTGVGRLLVAGTAVGALGLAADVWRLRGRWLVAGTAVAAAFVVPYGETGPALGVLAVGWITLVAAAFRGLDHADGLAGTVGVVTAFGIGACAAVELMDGLAVLLSALAAALAGFLLHNRHPARVALGACGSLFAGFLLAGAAVFTRAGHAPGTGAGVLFALTALASVDAVLVLLSRRLAGRPLLRGGPDHLAHRLRRLGLTPQGAVVVLGAVASGGVLVGVLVHIGWAGEAAALWVAGGAVAGVPALLRVRVYEPPKRRAGTDTRARTSPHWPRAELHGQMREQARVRGQSPAQDETRGRGPVPAGGEARGRGQSRAGGEARGRGQSRAGGEARGRGQSRAGDEARGAGAVPGARRGAGAGAGQGAVPGT